VRATEETAPALDGLALITIAFEAYSDAALARAEVSHTAAPDPACGYRPMGSNTVRRAKAACEGIGRRRHQLSPTMRASKRRIANRSSDLAESNNA
jgi:hypothetical protein